MFSKTRPGVPPRAEQNSCHPVIQSPLVVLLITRHTQTEPAQAQARLTILTKKSYSCREAKIFSVNKGTMRCKSPTIPTSATLKIGASGSLLMAMM